MAVVSSVDAGLIAIQKGATILQLRGPELTARELEREAGVLVSKASVPVIVSSRCDVALAAGAAGVNLPERDIGAADARSLLGQRLVGRSVHSVTAARSAEVEGADFVIFGPVWASASHPGQEPRGVAALTELTRALKIPVIAIGGVTKERGRECEAAGAAGFAAITTFQ